MKQLVLDMALPTAPSLSNFCAGPNHDALSHLLLWLGEKGSEVRSPLSTYLWGDPGSGKTHLLQAMRAALAARLCQRLRQSFQSPIKAPIRTRIPAMQQTHGVTQFSAQIRPKTRNERLKTRLRCILHMQHFPEG